MGRSGIIILIVIVLLAIGAYFVLHKKAPDAVAPATTAVTAPVAPVDVPAAPAPATPEAVPAPAP